MEMLANWSKVKTIQELIDEAFWLRTAIIRYLARENKRPGLKMPLTHAVEQLMDFHVSSITVKNGEVAEVEAKNMQGEKILKTIRADLAFAGIDIERIIEEVKRDNAPKLSEDKDPWA